MLSTHWEKRETVHSLATLLRSENKRCKKTGSCDTQLNQKKKFMSLHTHDSCITSCIETFTWLLWNSSRQTAHTSVSLLSCLSRFPVEQHVLLYFLIVSFDKASTASCLSISYSETKAKLQSQAEKLITLKLLTEIFAILTALDDFYAPFGCGNMLQVVTSLSVFIAWISGVLLRLHNKRVARIHTVKFR